MFAISYKNPSADMSGTTMDDYLVNGPQTALDVIEEITGAETIDIVGLCLGGAMTAITAAYLTQDGRQPDRHADPAEHDARLRRARVRWARSPTCATVERLEKKMLKAGALEGETMAGTFDILRANDLIFNYVVSNWLMGQPPPAFDILAWNADSTRMPAAMHAFYLRNFYVENNLAAGELEIGGAPIDLSVIKNADLRGQRDQRSHRAVGVGLQDGRSGERAGPVRAGQRRAHRRHRQPARARRPGTWSATATPLPATGAEWREIAERRPGLVVGGLGGVVRRQLRPAAGPAADGQRHVPGARRRPGRLRQGLSPAADQPHGALGARCRTRSWRRRPRRRRQLAGQAAGGDGQGGHDRLQFVAEVVDGEFDGGDDVAAWSEDGHRDAADAGFEFPAGDGDPGEPGDGQGAAEPVG